MLTSYKEINQDLIADGLPPNDLSQIPESYSEGKFDGEIGLEAAVLSSCGASQFFTQDIEGMAGGAL